MDLQRKIALLDKQIEDANNGNPADFQGWKDQTDVVLRTVMGENSPTHTKFLNVRYSPSVMYAGMDTSGYRPGGVKQVMSILEAAKLELGLAAEVEEVVDQPASGTDMTGHRVFIVHGHDDAKKHELARFLLAVTGEEPVILHEQPNRGRVLIEKFEQSAASTGYAVVLLTGDYLGRAKADTDDQPRGRQNVAFEMGFFFGAFGRDRVAVLFEEGVEVVGDVAGLVYIPIDAAGGWKTALASELEAAGIPVKWQALGRKVT